MTSKYIRRPASSGWIEDEHFAPEPSPTPILSVCEHEAVDTGLLWGDGSPVLRAPNPIGFHEWSEA